MYTNRISTAARYDLLTSDIKKNEANYNRLMAQLASGKKISSITDDPIAAVNIINTNRQLGQLETFNGNVNLGMEQIQTMDDLLKLANGYATSARDKALQANTGTYGTSSLKALKVEIDEITKTMVDLANTEFNDGFVFGGANSKLTPYTIDENGDITYHGTPYSNPEYEKRTEVADGVFEVVNTTGDRVFGYYKGAVEAGNGVYTAEDGRRVIQGDDGIYRYENGNLYNTGRDGSDLTEHYDEDGNLDYYLSPEGKKVIAETVTDDSGNTTTIYKYKDGGLYGHGTDSTGLTDGAEEEYSGIMGTLKILSNSIQQVIDAREAGDADAEAKAYELMNSTLDMFNDDMNTMTTEQTKFGGVYNRLEMTESTLETNNENMTSYLSQLQDVDLASAVSEWYLAQYAYQASLQVAAQSMNMSLLNYI